MVIQLIRLILIFNLIILKILKKLTNNQNLHSQTENEETRWEVYTNENGLEDIEFPFPALYQKNCRMMKS